MKKILVLVLILLVAFASWRLVTTKASLNSTSTTKMTVASTTLNFKLNGDNDNSLELNLGDVRPGDSDKIDITVNNIGDISGSLCVKGESISPGFTVQSSNMCSVNIDPNGSVQFEINWSLPLTAHDTGLDGTDFQFSYSFLFENGYKVTKLVNLKGTIIDPTDTPTSTLTDTPTPTPTNTSTKTLVPKATDTLDPPSADTNTPTPTETPHDTLVPTATDTPLPTATDTLMPPTDVATNVPTEIATDVATDVTTDVATNVPTAVP